MKEKNELDGRFPAFVRADAHHFLQREHEDLAVANLAGLGGLHDRIDGLARGFIRHGDLDLYLREEIHGVFAATVDFGVTFLAAKSFHFRDGHALDTGGGECFLHFLELEGLDDGDDEFHASAMVEGLTVF